ncbi:MAG: tetraacyldisaccharide 4'-kinase [Calditrichia bacterium]
MNRIGKYLIWLLFPLGLIHLFVLWVRNKLYDANLIKSRRLPAPVISVGNIQLGGSGKTPLVIKLAEQLQQQGLKVGVLTRGYKRSTTGDVIVDLRDVAAEQINYLDVGDEPAIIAKHLKDGAIGIGANRYEVGLNLLQKNPVDILLLDDGFQHRRLQRDVDICLINVSQWRTHPFLFPFSYLRDLKSSLKRADLIVLTKIGTNTVLAENLKNELKRSCNSPVITANFSVRGLGKVSGERIYKLQQMAGRKAGAFCGIATPADFFATLREQGLEVVFGKSFPDHYEYKLRDVIELGQRASESCVDILITTEKDAVKLQPLIEARKDKLPDVYFLQVSLNVENEDEFSVFVRRKILEAIGRQ